MARKPRTKMDPFEREIELAFEPGTFVPDGMCFSFVHDLEQIAATIDTMVGSEPARAVVLYESFLAGCYQKADDLDDSSGGFGRFVGELYCGWVKARQANGADPDETVSRLLSWMDDDPYGFCYHLEKDVAGVLDRTHLAAFVKQVRARFDGAAAATAADGGTVGNRPDYLRRRWGEALRTLYVAQKDVTSYIALTQETELTATTATQLGAYSWRDARPTRLSPGSIEGSSWTRRHSTVRRPATTSPNSSANCWSSSGAETKRSRQSGPSTSRTPARSGTVTS